MSLFFFSLHFCQWQKEISFSLIEFNFGICVNSDAPIESGFVKSANKETRL